MFKSRLDLYRKYIYFLKGMYSKKVKFKKIEVEFRTYLAHIVYSDIADLLKKRNLLLDVGGARGEFCKVLKEEYELDCVNLDIRRMEEILFLPTVVAGGQNLPFRNEVFDIVICRALLEHVSPKVREQILDEIHRVLKKDGISHIAIPPWFNPHAGHGLRPFHILPFRLAVYLTRHITGRDIKAKSLEELGLYPITFRRMSKLIQKHGFKIICCNDALLRNHFLSSIPIIREFLIPTVSFNVRKITPNFCP